MTLHARQNVVPFYTRLGYAPEGEIFEEVTIPHQAMAKQLGLQPVDPILQWP